MSSNTSHVLDTTFGKDHRLSSKCIHPTEAKSKGSKSKKQVELVNYQKECDSHNRHKMKARRKWNRKRGCWNKWILKQHDKDVNIEDKVHRLIVKDMKNDFTSFGITRTVHLFFFFHWTLCACLHCIEICSMPSKNISNPINTLNMWPRLFHFYWIVTIRKKNKIKARCVERDS